MSVAFDDDAVADHFDRCVDAGLRPDRFSRIWVHTHPGESPEPSSTDEETFARVFGACDWALMFIVGRTARTYARLRFNAGPGGEVLLATTVDWETWPLAMEEEGDWDTRMSSWMDEFGENVFPIELQLGPTTKPERVMPGSRSFDLYDWSVAEQYDPFFDPTFDRIMDPWFDAAEGVMA